MSFEPRAAREYAESASATTLLSRLLDHATALVRNELALAKAEIIERADSLLTIAGAMVLGGVVLLAGTLTLSAAAVLGLTQVIAPWLAALAIGLPLVVIGFVMVASAKRKLSKIDLDLDHTDESLHKDAALAARRT